MEMPCSLAIGTMLDAPNEFYRIAAATGGEATP
jgi:hypothetical protein